MRAILLAAALLTSSATAAKQLSLLSPRDLDPALILPPPPAPGSAQAAAEMAELRNVEATRTPAEEAAAALDGDTKNATIFAEALGPRFDLDRLPATAQLLKIVRASETDVVDRGKAHFQRLRPYAVDPTLKSCKRNEDIHSSYPSGHTTMAFAMAEILARLDPAKAPAILARAARYGQSRIICEQHFRSDVAAGQMLGFAIADRLMAKPAFRKAFASAQREWPK
jgi:acid phosphatase (class A)